MMKAMEIEMVEALEVGNAFNSSEKFINREFLIQY
jgi:hypothetical protein